VPLNDAFDDRETDSRSRILVPPGVKPLENRKNPVMILRIDSDTVVPNGKEVLVALMIGTDVDARGLAITTELQRVFQQVLEDLLQL